MNEELEQAVQTQTQIETNIEPNVERRLDDLPRYEDMLKSEKEVSVQSGLQGLKQADVQIKFEDRPFAREQDKRKVYLKRRLKIVTVVYSVVLALLLTFTIVNIVTLASLNKKITNNTNTIQAESSVVELLKTEDPAQEEMKNIEISLNEPRDYSEDYKDLTFFDKISILFRNLFS